MSLVNICSLLLYGARFNKSSEAGSVASASDAKLSIIKFNHSIYTELNGVSYSINALKKLKKSATTFAVN